jgi:hypothetical protein
MTNLFWTILCWLFGVDQDEWDLDCRTVINEAGRDLEHALFVCGYKSLFHMQCRHFVIAVRNKEER